ncbi:hypothetical protein CVT24_002570 [Panaeolus cyanescens]|uniref:Uncharacterized protein n=1 Tax=Panaeolus cyanescens TaxID=181874 RepID=A0A409YU02_9AGAR|nr:hypothetical protein CVT24_002570 [Panaeolus cyanescens]
MVKITVLIGLLHAVAIVSAAPAAEAAEQAKEGVVVDPGVTFTPRTTSLEFEARDSINNCYDSTIENRTSGGSPLVADCQRMTVHFGKYSRSSNGS